ncbi:CP2 transcription factor-domain-containing protein [Mucor mucedo]|uniref:CP2 transcription factor-domain-containing protein n=1 Tax=Mucor mucedo TaxID=29922 RepID=UPI00221FFE9D|nr:CP2 transcription factor-domain-containing protein [Mucor mucedo]KAI7874274.1 CP2 transcription factor-domain-containing protein [Mucor mucedo]
MLRSNQLTYRGSSPPSSDSLSSYHHYQHPIYQYNYYNSPASINSPISSPHILNHLSYYPTIPMDSYSSSPHIQQLSSPSSPPVSGMSNTNISAPSPIRYDISLEAPTAASQKIDEPPLTYLNKGQYYNITLKDKERFDGDIISVVSITFHDESHRMGATDYWKFWLTQQKDSDKARAVEIDLTRSSGAQAIECRQFDRISFKWNGKLGASVHIRFNCLSTDFSRIKGVKGIPLRLQIESEQGHINLIEQTVAERTYCRIKLFRDKGAERKNKDDAKHIERQLEKNRGKNGEPHPLWLAFSPTAPVTLFREVIPPEEEESNHHHLEDGRYSHDILSSVLPPPTSMKRSYSNFQASNDIHNLFHSPSVMPSALTIAPPIPAPNTTNTTTATPIGLDPNYIPQIRRRIAKLMLLIKYGNCDIYRAIYLEHLTVKELTEKLVQRLEITRPVASILRKIVSKDKKRSNMIVEVNDEVIQDMTEEQDIFIETQETGDSKTSINLILNF